MKTLLRKILKIAAYVGATVVILLAIAVGLFRLLLPRLPEYQEEIKGWAAAAIGMDVEFSGMNARWRLSGPELNFYNAELQIPGDAGGGFAADEVSIGVDLLQLMLERQLVVDQIVVRDSTVDVYQDEAGQWRVQDIPLDVLADRFAGEAASGQVTVIAEDIDVAYLHPGSESVVGFTIANLRLNRRATRTDADALLQLPADMGNRLRISATGEHRVNGPAAWQFNIDSRDLVLAGWSGFRLDDWPAVIAGRADLSASLRRSGDHISNAVVEFTVEGLQAAGESSEVGASGQLEYESDVTGWLVVANDFRLTTASGRWPEAQINLQGSSDDDGGLRTLSASANYLNLGDLAYLLPWLPADTATRFRQYDPSGSVANLTANFAEPGTPEFRYDVSMELSDAGVLAVGPYPGIRGFSGSLRANRSGGRLEIGGEGIGLDLSRWLSEPVTLQSAEGTVIWRRSGDGIIVLSDSIRLRNADMSSTSSVQLSLPADGSSPVLDLESRWSIRDLREAKRYLPAAVINPGLYNWLSTALVAGSVSNGTTRFSGALEQFPFDDGDGVFRIEARMQDATLRYSDLWPDVENLNLDLIVDRTRLYSDNNTAINAGNSVVNADIEIADLREPVLRIDAFATGTLESIRQFAINSPISSAFGGHLDKVRVEGDASFNLLLNYPILDRANYSFTTRIRSSGGTLYIDGFRPPVSELNGVVNVSRDAIGSEALFGRFMGEPINIALRSAGDDEAGYSVVADVDGQLDAAGVADAFGIDLTPFASGSADFRGALRFPRAGAASPAPFRIDIESDLDGMAVTLPDPLGKERGIARQLLARVLFPEQGVIRTAGSLGEDLRWNLDFTSSGQGWDFDRGTMTAGGAEPGDAGTRGLHISGATPVIRLREWLALANRPADAGGVNIAERIRSIDLQVSDLYVFSQHFSEHRVVLDRSGADWLVQIDGEQAQGRLTIPYDFSSGRTLSLEMQKLILPGSDEDSEATAFTGDPRQIPPLTIEAQEFALGNRFLGAVSARFEQTPNGLESNDIRTEDQTFSIEGAAGWVVDTSEASGQRTWVNASLQSSDVAATLQRLDSQPGLAGEDMSISFDVSWSGGPREDFLETLDGAVNVRLGTGRLDEVEPGAGRMFGLLSVVALPRRLALDFRDVLDRGFLFDEITGTFNLQDGNAFTCDLSLKGPAADIGIVGRAGLLNNDYTQAALVSANVGNTLPVVGAVVAGPQVAAALLIFSQIFKKPLQDLGQVYYAIDGSWSEPEVDTSDPAHFAETSRMAGCLTEGS